MQANPLLTEHSHADEATQTAALQQRIAQLEIENHTLRQDIAMFRRVIDDLLYILKQVEQSASWRLGQKITTKIRKIQKKPLGRNIFEDVPMALNPIHHWKKTRDR